MLHYGIERCNVANMRTQEHHGPFAQIEDLVSVEGFNASRVARLAPRVTL